MSTGLPDRPSWTGPSQERIDRFRTNRLQAAHSEPSGPKPPGKKAPSRLNLPVAHSREGHKFRSEFFRKPALDFLRQRRADEKRAERDCILAGPKPTLEQRLAAIPQPTFTPIAPKPVLLNFEKLAIADLVRIFTPKFDATLKRLDVFETFAFGDHVDQVHIKHLCALIERLTHLKRALKDSGSVRTWEEFQGWNFGLTEIGRIKFQGLRKNQVQIIKALSAVWNGGYFENQ